MTEFHLARYNASDCRSNQPPKHSDSGVQLLTSRVIGQVVLSRFHLSDYGVNQELAVEITSFCYWFSNTSSPKRTLRNQMQTRRSAYHAMSHLIRDVRMVCLKVAFHARIVETPV